MLRRQHVLLTSPAPESVGRDRLVEGEEHLDDLCVVSVRGGFESPIEQCCATLKVSRSAFFDWRHRQADPTAKMVDDADLAELIAKLDDQSRGTYGRPRVTGELRFGLGRRVNHKRVQRLMREHGLRGITGGRRSKGCTGSRAR